jgi:hypothetical protein
MSQQMDRRSEITAWLILIGVGIVFPMSAVLIAYWFFHISLPTLMFIAFVLLFLAGFLRFPDGSAPDPDGEVRSMSDILLIVGLASGLAVLILFFVRLLSQGGLFTWT